MNAFARTLRLPVSACAFAALAIACRPDLPEYRGLSVDDEPSALSVGVEPDVPLGELPQTFRVRIRAPEGVALTPDDVYLASGTLGAPSLQALERGEPSSSLEARLVELVRWSEGEEIVVAPTEWLPAGERFALAIPPLGVSVRLDTAEPAPPRLDRVFPPPDVLSPLLVYCGELELPAFERELSLAPSAVPARFSRGTPGGRTPRCATLELLHAAELALPPPALEIDGAIWSLEPRPIEAEIGRATEGEQLVCEPDELRFGPGCALVEDDRLRLRTPERPLFWAVSAKGFDMHFVTRASATTTVRGFEPSTRQTVGVEWLEASGQWRSSDVTLETSTPRAHFLLSEVYADAIGPEPQQEWVEISNDGLVAGSLEGLLLVDVGAATELPEAWLAPGEHVLVVEEGFDPSGAWDAPPAAGTKLVRVPKLGKSGLSNQGEPLRLDDPSGRVLSRAPALPKPKPGISIARRHPSASDDDPASFARAELGPTPGLPNEGSFED